jgi:hypothetical protein
VPWDGVPGSISGLLAGHESAPTALIASGDVEARTQLTARIALGVVEPRDGELILGAGRLSQGWRPAGWPGRATSWSWCRASTSSHGPHAPTG